MQPFRIRGNDTIAQGFIHAELEFAFYRSPPPGISDICYPELKLSTNAAQLVACCLSSKTPPNAPQKLQVSWEVELRASTTIAPRGVRSRKPPCSACAELEFWDYRTLKRPGRIRSSGCSVTFKLLFHPERSESPKLPKEVELRECAAPPCSLKLELPLPYSARTPRR